MGMFDEINIETTCPECGAIVDDFQSKDGECAMLKIEANEVHDFYSSCPVCKLYLDAKMIPPTICEFMITASERIVEEGDPKYNRVYFKPKSGHIINSHGQKTRNLTSVEKEGLGIY